MNASALNADNSPSSPATLSESDQRNTWIMIGLATAVLVFAYWNSLFRVTKEWERPEYSHGYLIPVFALGLLWLRRQKFTEVPTWHRWVGLAILCGGILLRVLATRFVYFTVDYASLIPCILGVFVMFGGLRVLRWAGPTIVFLVFMFPLPTFLKTNLLERMQTFATRGSVYAMQTLGVDAFREGNNIHLMNKPLNVQEACAGLRMLTIFIAIAVAMALIVNYRPWWQRLVIVVSAIPIALAVNVIRITVTGLLYNLDVPERIAHFFFHDLAGYFMMPLALVFLFLELKILDNLFIEVEEKSFVPGGISPVQPS